MEDKKTLTTTPPAGRPLYKRWTVVGASIIAVVEALDQQKLIPPGFLTMVTELGQNAGGLLAALGLYRHIPTT